MSELVKVKIMKQTGDHAAGSIVEVSPYVAEHLCDGKKAVLLSVYEKLEEVRLDPSNLTVKEMNDMNMKNTPVNPDVEAFAKAEAAALAGKPVAAGEPVVTTGGITPPTQVFPAMAEAVGHETTDPSEVKAKKSDAKPEAKIEKKGK